MTSADLEPNMIISPPEDAAVRCGSLDGYGRVYTEEGGLLLRPTERVLRDADGWDVLVYSPWQRFLPKAMFEPFKRETRSKLYITTDRVVLLREVLEWRGSTARRTPPLRTTGMTEAEIQAEILRRAVPLSKARQYCEIWPQRLRVVDVKRRRGREWSFLIVRALGTDGRQYRIQLSQTSAADNDTLTRLESQFPAAPMPIR